MSISMTWANYALIVSACLAVYYCILFIFYRKYFSHFLPTRMTNTSDTLSNLSEDDKSITNPKNLNLFGEEVIEEESLSVSEEQGFSPDAQDFADEMMAYTSSCGDDIAKEDLLQNLRKIILKYPSIPDSESRYELSQLILISTENNCFIHLSADELSELWNG